MKVDTVRIKTIKNKCNCKSEFKQSCNVCENDSIISQISDIRVNNNKCWMDILRLAFKNNEAEAKNIFKSITDNDGKINKLSKELCK